MKSQGLHTVWCNISGEAAGEIWEWSLVGVKGLRNWSTAGVAQFSPDLATKSIGLNTADTVMEPAFMIVSSDFFLPNTR